ncbi:hypothetical protein OROMI_031399 [Orobanche minor]
MKNGVVVGFVYKDVKGRVFHTVSIDSQNEELTDRILLSFLLNGAYEAAQRAKQQLKVDGIRIPQDASYGHYGYEETPELFDIAGKSTVPPISVVPENDSNEEKSMYTLNHIKTLRELIKFGKIDETFVALCNLYPQIVQDDTIGILETISKCSGIIKLQ